MPMIQPDWNENLKSLPFFGHVFMVFKSGHWKTFKPDGSPLDITGTTTQGLQESINYAQRHAFPLIVHGGGVTPPIVGVPPSTALSMITCSTTVSFPTGWNNMYHFYNVNFVYSGWPGNDFFTFDSCDLTEVDFHNSQIIYPGTAAAFHFRPYHDNGESFAGFVCSSFYLGHIIPVVSVADMSPDPSKGIGILITVPNLGLGLSFANGYFYSCHIKAYEIHGGQYGIKLENPAVGSGGFAANVIETINIHNQSIAAVQVGTSALPNTTADTSWGNIWRLGGVWTNNGIGISTWGGNNTSFFAQWGGDYFELSCIGGAKAVQFESSATCNRVNLIANSAGTAYVNNAIKQTNIIEDARPVYAATLVSTVAPPGSPWSWQNNLMKSVAVYVKFGIVSLIQVSIDGSTWIDIAYNPGDVNTVLKPGEWIRVTYSMCPNVDIVY
jgi:hypothetical protein